MDRRLPVYLVVDCSESMVGEPIEAVARGLDVLLNELRQHPQAIETAWVSLIQFWSRASQLVPLTEVLQFRVPQLGIGPGTGLGAALSLLCNRIDREVQKSTPDRKGDWTPVVFLLTDGQPTDAWQGPAGRLRERSANLIAVGCGPDADMTVLRQVTPNALLMQNATPADFAAFFKWVSASVAGASVQLGQEARPMNLPDAPPGLLRIAGDQREVPPGLPSQVILAARCRHNRQPYLMRYRKGPQGEGYVGAGSYPVPESYFTESREGQGGGQIHVQQLKDAPSCPHCGENGWGRHHDCGGLLCCPPPGGTLKCPHCGVTAVYRPDVFDVGKAVG